MKGITYSAEGKRRQDAELARQQAYVEALDARQAEARRLPPAPVPMTPAELLEILLTACDTSPDAVALVYPLIGPELRASQTPITPAPDPHELSTLTLVELLRVRVVEGLHRDERQAVCRALAEVLQHATGR
jgi:hypothetical protein